jgi:predicted TPR repeat methyltransferase
MVNSEYNYSDMAEKYDQEVKTYASFGHDVLFGLCFEFVNKGQKLLDLGIGTGLSAKNFLKLGLHVTGVDSSEEMLKVCKAKKRASEFRQADLKKEELGLVRQSFDHVISCGLLHFFGDLEFLVSQVSDAVKAEGVFAFTIAHSAESGGFREEESGWGVPIFKHSFEYVDKLLCDHGFKLEKEQRLLAKGADKETYNMEFTAFVYRRTH